jgi:hypothetical protein
MTARRLQHALANTLYALDSRYSDVDGWYLWGVVLREAPTMKLSLCSDALDSLPLLPRAVARNVMERLVRQLRLCSPPVQSGDLDDVTVMLALDWRGGVPAHPSRDSPRRQSPKAGFSSRLAPDRAGVLVTIVAVLSSGARVERRRIMDARPHNPHAELRSVRREPTTRLRPLLEWL